jgi:hypothetical protein
VLDEPIAIKKGMATGEFEVGELVEAKFLDHSYVLHLNGEIRDRKTNQLLSELKTVAQATIGRQMIERKPSGGRLRISREGIVAAYFEDHWGYLATVTPEQWFPNHLLTT